MENLDEMIDWTVRNATNVTWCMTLIELDTRAIKLHDDCEFDWKIQDHSARTTCKGGEITTVVYFADGPVTFTVRYADGTTRGADGIVGRNTLIEMNRLNISNVTSVAACIAFNEMLHAA